MAIHYQHQLDRTFHALGDGTRRKMLSLLAKRGEVTASDLGAPFEIAQPTVSKHIRVLEQAGLISRRVEGRVHRFQLQIKPFNEAQKWISKHREFWEGSLDALGDLLEEMSADEES
ncbi:ArsR/SmtB family transcription factor [Gimesia fumaroli]|uniref:Transcriptional repressor SdpR n=1 Tax=Gimesia fumaroli TaxID=2527976 RepID=A0A518IGP1_9PLAN|nr:metalloregulator ArsR/SmtB family transcription factor [Gimesia fumaroli]QDV52261.1 Transcriptional repressor SdpR [Gimesia fumaroli]